MTTPHTPPAAPVPPGGNAGLTFGQAAARLGVDVNTVRRWARTEACPVVREGRAVRIPVSFIEGLLAGGWR